jgi:hypothetical protein
MSTILDGKEVTFEFNKYKNPALLSKKESLVQIILNGLLMIPGNCPSQPLKGCDIFQYLYKHEDEGRSTEILQNLKFTCGDEVGSLIKNLTVQTIELDGAPTMLLIIAIEVDSEADAVALLIQKVNEKVTFNYSFCKEELDALE